MKTATLIFLMTFGLLPTKSYVGMPSGEVEVGFVGSTPFSEEIRAINNVPVGTGCDKVSWNLTLNRSLESGLFESFVLSSVWGFHINNWTWQTRGKNDAIKGQVRVTKDNPDYPEAEVYILTATDSRASIRFLRLDNNLIHVLNKDGRVAVGTGGESFTLNRIVTSKDTQILFSFINSEVIPEKDRLNGKLVLHGRTPAEPIGSQMEYEVPPDRQKIKWLITLNVNQDTGEPTTFNMRRILEEPTDVSGNWKIDKGWKGQSSTTVYQLEFGQPAHTIHLLKGSDDVFFFLNEEGHLLVGNKEFDFTLNRKVAK